MRFRLIFILFVFSIFFLPTTSLAISEKTVGGSLVATINPKNPGPNERVSINLIGYGYDINQSDIAWVLNGKVIKKGIGNKSFTFNTGRIGDLSVLAIILKTKEGKTIAKQITITPGLINLIWEADTYTPEFYKGAELPSSNSKIRVTAIPQIKYNGKLVSNKDLVFNWKKDYKNLIRESGLGQNFIEFTAGRYPNKHTIEVTVEYPKLADSFYNKIDIPLTNPEIIVYPFKPLSGIIKNNPIKDNFQAQTEVESFKAEGYFFPRLDINNKFINFTWSINDKPVSISNSDRSILDTKTDTENSGQSRINIRAYNILNPNLEAKYEFNILLAKSLFNF